MVKSRYWVTLSLRLFGLVLVVVSFGRIGNRVGGYVRDSIWRVPVDRFPREFYDILNETGTVLLFAFGLYLVLGGNWVVNRLVRGLEANRCFKCNYDMSGLSEGAVCPECGEASDR